MKVQHHENVLHTALVMLFCIKEETPTALTRFGLGLLLYIPRSRSLHERFTYLITCRILNVVMKILKLLLKNHIQLYFHA